MSAFGPSPMFQNSVIIWGTHCLLCTGGRGRKTCSQPPSPITYTRTHTHIFPICQNSRWLLAGQYATDRKQESCQILWNLLLLHCKTHYFLAHCDGILTAIVKKKSKYIHMSLNEKCLKEHLHQKTGMGSDFPFYLALHSLSTCPTTSTSCGLWCCKL